MRLRQRLDRYARRLKVERLLSADELRYVRSFREGSSCRLTSPSECPDALGERSLLKRSPCRNENNVNCGNVTVLRVILRNQRVKGAQWRPERHRGRWGDGHAHLWRP